MNHNEDDGRYSTVIQYLASSHSPTRSRTISLRLSVSDKYKPEPLLSCGTGQHVAKLKSNVTSCKPMVCTSCHLEFTVAHASRAPTTFAEKDDKEHILQHWLKGAEIAKISS